MTIVDANELGRRTASALLQLQELDGDGVANDQRVALARSLPAPWARHYAFLRESSSAPWVLIANGDACPHCAAALAPALANHLRVARVAACLHCTRLLVVADAPQPARRTSER